MGYESRFKGEILIDPPLGHEWIRQSGIHTVPQGWPDLKFRVAEEQVETPEGTLIRRTAGALIPGREDRFTGYDFDASLRAAVRELAELGCRLSGSIVRYGEDQGDVERWLVTTDNENCNVRSEKARLLWSDGSEVQPS